MRFCRKVRGQGRAVTRMAAASGRGGDPDGFSVSMRLMGACLYVAWIEVVFSGDAFIPAPWITANAAAAIFPCATLGLAVGLLAMALQPVRAAELLASRPLVYVASLLGAACTAAVCIPGPLPPWAFYLLAFLAGVSTSVPAMLSGMLISEMDSRSAILTLAFVQIIGVLLFSFAAMAYIVVGPLLAVAILVALLPCATLLLKLDDGRPTATFDAFSLKMPVGFWRLVAALAVIEFACASVRGFFPSALADDQFSQARWITALVLLVLLIAVMVFAGTRRIDAPFGSILYYLLLAITAVVASVPLLGYASPLSGILATALFALTLLVAWAILLRVSYRSGASVVTVFGFGYAAAAVGSDLGFVFGASLAEAGLPAATVSVVTVVEVLLCVAAAFALLKRDDIQVMMEPVESSGEDLFVVAAADTNAARTNRTDGEAADRADRGMLEVASADRCTDLAAQPGRAEASEEFEKIASGQVVHSEAAPSQATPLQTKALFKARCDAIAEKYGLSDRETDVFHLIARGYDARAIADELVVSYNTARTHIRNIYVKMDVHSRHEFFDIINSSENRL